MTAPPELAALRTRLAEIADLQRVGALLAWDQQVTMPPAGAAGRGELAGTLERVLHERVAAPALGALLDGLAGWADGEDPDGDDARLVAAATRDHRKATRVPASLAGALAEAGAAGQAAWLTARESGRFADFAPALERHLELRRSYVECFPEAERPYDVLLDDFEPGMTTAELEPVLAELRDGLTPLVAATASTGGRPNGGVLDGAFPEAAQRRVLDAVLGAVGLDDRAWRLDAAAHPFATGIGVGDTRITTRYAPDELGMALYSGLHELGHGLYEAGSAPRLARTTLDQPASLAIHESQSRLWENLVGRSRPFCAWLVPRIKAALGPDGAPLAGLEPDALFAGLNAVTRSAIRVEADETTYNLHVVLRFELELALVEGRLAVADLPDAWRERMASDLGVEVRDDLEGVLQDIHWGVGAIGYFATYALGNLVAAQLFAQLRLDEPELDSQVARGDFAPLRAWLGEHVHRHGRTFASGELVERVTGAPLSPRPFLDYLAGKLAASGALSAPGRSAPRRAGRATSTEA